MTEPQSTQRREARRLRLTRKLADAVEQLLANGDSYSDLSVETLITAVGVSRYTFYQYFHDKGDLLQAIGEDVTVDLAQAGAPWFELPATASKGDLRAAQRSLFETYRRHRTVMRAISDAAAYDARIREVHQELVTRAAAALRSHITEQQRLGAAAPELDADRTALWLVWMLERGLQQLVAPAPAREFDRLLDTMTDVTWRTLYEGYRR